MIVTTTLVASGFVVFIRFWLKDAFPFLEFATWLAGFVALAFAS
jgi:hypothetical protein